MVAVYVIGALVVLSIIAYFPYREARQRLRNVAQFRERMKGQSK